MLDYIKQVKFKDVNFEDSFFDSLKNDYIGIDKWFEKKSNENAYILKEGSNILGFLYLKIEEEADDSISPTFPQKKRLKVGTFKVTAHGTKVGERFLKLIFDCALEENISEIYVTIFKKHSSLINLMETYGFNLFGTKSSKSGIENVYVKYFNYNEKSLLKNYPLIKKTNNCKHLLSIYPKYHTPMFPDSKLKTEKGLKLKDASHTNSIQKIYLSGSKYCHHFNPGDHIVIYRTKDYDRPNAYYSSVATSITTIVEVKHISSFENYNSFYDYCKKFSIFSDSELKSFWTKRKYPFIIKMLYNVALNKRITRKDLINFIGLDNYERWTAIKLSDSQFNNILKLGEVNEGFIID